MRLFVSALLALAAVGNALKLHKVTLDENAFDDSNGMFYQREDFDVKDDLDKRAAGVTGCGKAPNPPNTNIVGTVKSFYSVGDVITYRCNPAYMRLVDGSLQATCQSNGNWSALPVCQSYTFGCRRNQVAREYRGAVNRTRCGQPCQPWSSNSPNKPSADVQKSFSDPNMFPEYKNVYDAQAFCRNPDPGEYTGPWCYINDMTSKDRWGYCDVEYCNGTESMSDYDRRPGACGCQSEWYNAIRNFGNIKTLEGTTMEACKYECDNNALCQGIVHDETLAKCWLKKCTCADSEVICSPIKHETYFRKKTPPCPGVEYYDRFNQRHCYYSLYNFNLNTSLVFDWPTSRKLCQDLFPLVSDVIALETNDESDFLTRNYNKLQIPVAYTQVWIGLFRPEDTSDAWQWAIPPNPFDNGYRPLLNYSRWAPGEPTNGYEEQCVQVILSTKVGEDKSVIGRFTDESCRVRSPVICEAIMPNFRTSKREDDKKREDEEQLAGSEGSPHPRCKTDPCPTYDKEGKNE